MQIGYKSNFGVRLLPHILALISLVVLFILIGLGIEIDVYSVIMQLLAALFAVIFGIKNCFKWKKPLYLQIVTGGFVCFFLGQLFLACKILVMSESPYGFSIANLSFAGFYFFLCSAEYGALDSIVDNKGDVMSKRYRVLAGIAPLILIIMLVIAFMLGESILEIIIQAVPMIFVSYFVLKHILIPDIELGFTKTLLPYYILVLLFCFMDCLVKIFAQLNIDYIEPIGGIIKGILLIYMMPVVTKGVTKWFT